MGIHQKILEVQKAVGYIKKNGKNTFHKYDYAMEADVLEVKRIMNEHGLIAYPSLVGYQTGNRKDDKGNDVVQVFQEIEYTVVDVESKEEVKCRVLGSGEDKGDKGTYKGSTGANKYFYLKFFGVATGDDPEADEKPVGKSEVASKTEDNMREVDEAFSIIKNLIDTKQITASEVAGFNLGTATKNKIEGNLKNLRFIIIKAKTLIGERNNAVNH